MEIRNKISDMTAKLRAILDQHGIEWIDASDFSYKTYYDNDGHIHNDMYHFERTRFNLFKNENGEDCYRTSVVWNWRKHDQGNYIGLSYGFPYEYEVWDKSYDEDPVPMSLEQIESIFMDRSM